MHDLAVEQVGDGGQPDMRMRAHVDAVADEELGRAHLVEEDEGPDHLPPGRRQRAAHREAAEIAGARHDDLLDGIASAMIARLRIFGWDPAHLFRSLTRTYCIGAATIAHIRRRVKCRAIWKARSPLSRA